MITKKTQDYDVTTKTHQITDNATGEAGKVAYTTFASEDKELSNDYIIPFHAIDNVVVKITNGTKEVEDDTCITGDEPTPPAPGKPTISGASNVSINQGIGIDLTEGVTAKDGNGNVISFTVEPTEIDKCDVGVHDVVYTATADGETTTVTRKVTINQIADPTISGLSELTVEVGEEFDPLEGVSAVDGNGNSIEVSVKEVQPTIYHGYVTLGESFEFVPAVEAFVGSDVDSGETYFSVSNPNIEYNVDGDGNFGFNLEYNKSLASLNSILISYVQVTGQEPQEEIVTLNKTGEAASGGLHFWDGQSLSGSTAIYLR